MIPTPWLLGGSALALVLMYAGWSIQVANIHSTHATEISAEEKKTRDVQGQWDAYKLQVEQTIGNNARQHASDLQAEIDNREAIAAQNERLRAANTAAFQERDSLSRELLRRLNDAPKTPESTLDGPSVDYYRELRERQLAARSGRNPAPP